MTEYMMDNQNKFRSGCFWHNYKAVIMVEKIEGQKGKKNWKKVETDKLLSLGRRRYWEWLAFTGKQMA